MLRSLLQLSGEMIVRWAGLEMALTGGNSVVTDDTVTSGWAGESPVRWEHPDIPYRQFFSLDIEVSAGGFYRLVANLDSAEDREAYSLLLSELDEMQRPSLPEAGSIFRWRELDELPVGQVAVELLRQDGPSEILEASLTIDGKVIRLLAAEVHERMDGTFDVAGPDETILLQVVDGQRPALDPVPERGLEPESSELLEVERFNAAPGGATGDPNFIGLRVCPVMVDFDQLPVATPEQRALREKVKTSPPVGRSRRGIWM